MIDTTLMSDDDKEAIEFAIRRGFKFPRYRANRIDHTGQPFVTEEYFKPVQFRAVTIVPFPECANIRNCLYLIGIWNASSAGRGSYELIND